ncbi:hypothetical protein ALC53_08668 [Atta colombica]|uniref:Uncharacterized protein n=1 Tax=Atta colombica TaxID=520822 RepID=A0A151I2B8_9HYME|nr:hypothetical protein ALC53_08668 [Atta colombica]
MRGPSLPREEHKSGINNVRRKSDFKDRKGKIALLSIVNAREQTAAPGTVVESMTSIPLAIII